MIRIATFVAVAAALSLAACQPQKTPEQIAAEQQAAAMKEMTAALGGMMSGTGEVDAEKLAAAIGQAGAMASALDPDMTAEDRAKLQTISGALQSGQVHPAASAYVSGLDRVSTLISGIKTDADVESARPQLAAIYAQMSAPAATLGAMSENDREIAFGSAYPQLLGFSMKMAGIMMPLASNPDLAEKVGDLLEGLPAPE